MKIATHSHRNGHLALGRCGKPVLALMGMLMGATKSDEDIFAVATHWRKFLQQHGWRELKTPLKTSGFVEDQFLISGRACVNLSLVHGNQVGHVLLAFQGLFEHKQIRAGVLCVGGKDTLTRVKADLRWLQDTITVPIWVVAVISASQ
jgi:hypothetical protein